MKKMTFSYLATAFVSKNIEVLLESRNTTGKQMRTIICKILC